MSPGEPYRPPVFAGPIELDLSKNEGQPWALPGSGLPETLWATANRYPDTAALREALADRHGVDPENVLVTAGGDDALFRCFLSRAGGAVVATAPSFEMIRRYSGQTGGRLSEVEWWEGPFPSETFLEVDADMAVVVSPNNPTGAVITAEALARVAARFELVVLDAAYNEFASVDLTPVALELDNVVVVRTLSKAYGLAGLRVGYLLGPNDRIAEVAIFGNPYPVSGVSAAVALGALEQGGVNSFVTEVVSQRERLAGMLGELGAEVLPSEANFVLARVPNTDWLVQGAAALGVGLRTFPDRPELDGWVRITVPGEPSGFDRLEQTLRSVLAPEVIIFDLDGVICDVGGSYQMAIIETAASFGVTIDETHILDELTLGDANDDWELTRRLCESSGVEVSREKVVARFEQIYQGTDDQPGLKMAERPIVSVGTLQTLADRMRLGIVTGRPRDDAEEFLERFDLTRFFDIVVTREDAPLKPDSAPVRLVLEKLGATRGWMLGDTPDDIVAARSAGVVPIGVVPRGADTTRYREMLGGAADVLDSTDQILEVLDGKKH